MQHFGRFSNTVILVSFWKLDVCIQTVFEQKLVGNAKIKKASSGLLSGLERLNHGGFWVKIKVWIFPLGIMSDDITCLLVQKVGS